MTSMTLIISSAFHVNASFKSFEYPKIWFTENNFLSYICYLTPQILKGFDTSRLQNLSFSINTQNSENSFNNKQSLFVFLAHIVLLK